MVTHLNDDMPLNIAEDSLIDLLEMRELVGEALQAIYWHPDPGPNDSPGFLFQFTNRILKILDVGDQLGLQLQQYQQENELLLLPHWFPIIKRE